MYNLYHIESPFQLLSAMSALKVFNQNKSILIIDLSSGKRSGNDEQILSLLDDRWDHVIVNRKKKGLLKIFSLIRDVIKYKSIYGGRIDKYFIGEYRNFNMALLRSAINPKEEILLDDGAYTIIAQSRYIRNNIFPYSHALKYKLFKSFLKNLKTPNLYSSFDLTLGLIDGQINYFQFPKKKDIKIDVGNVFFFGSKLSETKNILLSDELSILEKVNSHYEGYNVFYIPHRDESPDKLDKISHLGYTIKKLGKPAEVFFDETEIMPELVLSYYSTVIYTCYIRFNNVNLKSINIGKKILKKKTRDGAKEVYKYYEELGIGILDV